MREHLHELLEQLEPAARELACSEQLAAARDLLDRPRTASARELGAERHAQALAHRFLGA